MIYTCAGVTLRPPRGDEYHWAGRCGPLLVDLFDQGDWWEALVRRKTGTGWAPLVEVSDRSITTATQAIRAAERELRAIQRAIGRLGL